MTKQQHLRVNPQIVQEANGRGCLLIHKVTGDCYELNELGLSIWNGLQTGHSMAAIAEALAPKYGVSRATFDSDFESHIGDLLRHGLVLES